MLKGHAQSDKGHKINQELDSQSFSSPGEEASEEHDDHARLDRADEHGESVGPQESYAERWKIHGAVGLAANGTPAIDRDWCEHSEVLQVVDAAKWRDKQKNARRRKGRRQWEK